MLDETVGLLCAEWCQVVSGMGKGKREARKEHMRDNGIGKKSLLGDRKSRRHQERKVTIERVKYTETESSCIILWSPAKETCQQMTTGQ